MKSTLFFPITTFLASAHAATYNVTVGPGLSYSPSSVTASEGDVVAFTFGSGHDVVSGNFDSPCQPNGNVYSGEPNDGDVFSVTINSTDPIWIYCSVPHHCQGGMAMVINAPSDHTIDDYKSAAANAGSSSAPSDVVGGVFGAVEQSSSATSSAAASSASSASSAASSTRASASSTGSSASGTQSSTAASASSTTSSSTASAYGVSGLIFSFGAVLLAAFL